MGKVLRFQTGPDQDVCAAPASCGLWGLQGHSPTEMGPRHPQYHAQPSPWSQVPGKNQHHTPKSLCHSKAAGSFYSGNPVHWLPSFPQLWWKEQLQTVAFVSPRNIAVGWETPPGKKAPAMSFLAYYKESKMYQIENSYYYRDMLTKRNSIKLPQNTKHLAQRAAFIHLLRVHVGAEIYSVSHKHSIPLLLKGMSAGSRRQWAGEALTHPQGLGHPAQGHPQCPQPALGLETGRTQTPLCNPRILPKCVRTLCASEGGQKQGTLLFPKCKHCPYRTSSSHRKAGEADTDPSLCQCMLRACHERGDLCKLGSTQPKK